METRSPQTVHHCAIISVVSLAAVMVCDAAMQISFRLGCAHRHIVSVASFFMRARIALGRMVQFYACLMNKGRISDARWVRA
jgi:hypothetical protein